VKEEKKYVCFIHVKKNETLQTIRIIMIATLRHHHHKRCRRVSSLLSISNNYGDDQPPHVYSYLSYCSKRRMTRTNNENDHNRTSIMIRRRTNKPNRFPMPSSSSFFMKGKVNETNQCTKQNHSTTNNNNPKKDDPPHHNRSFVLLLKQRTISTMETIVSKIYPAGFGWQYMSLVTEYPSDTIQFAIVTGFGDACGVCFGHIVYYTIKQHLLLLLLFDHDDMDQKTKTLTTPPMIDVKKEIHIGCFLGMGAFCSGTSWQPIVLTLQSYHLSFEHVFLSTIVLCGSIFYIGMRMARTILSGNERLYYIQEPNYHNSHYDGSLALSIGCGTGFFVSTDMITYAPTDHILLSYFGLSTELSPIVACTIAGACVSVGFTTMQSILNIIYPRGKLWNDES
jgi:hypothetical protein